MAEEKQITIIEYQENLDQVLPKLKQFDNHFKTSNTFIK